MKRPTQRAVIALDLASLDSPGLVSFTRAIGKGLSPNTNFTAADLAKLPVAVVDLLAAATALESAHTVRLTAPSKTNTALERDSAGTVMDHLTDTAAFIEGLANTKAAGDVNLAGAIIVSVGFKLKKKAVRNPKGFDVDSPAKNTAHIHVPAGPANAVRLVSYSTDGGKTWSPFIVVHGTDITVTGLKSAIEIQVHMAISVPPLKKAKLTITAGTEEPAWGDVATCTIM